MTMVAVATVMVMRLVLCGACAQQAHCDLQQLAVLQIAVCLLRARATATERLLAKPKKTAQAMTSWSGYKQQLPAQLATAGRKTSRNCVQSSPISSTPSSTYTAERKLQITPGQHTRSLQKQLPKRNLDAKLENCNFEAFFPRILNRKGKPPKLAKIRFEPHGLPRQLSTRRKRCACHETEQAQHLPAEHVFAVLCLPRTRQLHETWRRQKACACHAKRKSTTIQNTEKATFLRGQDVENKIADTTK